MSSKSYQKQKPIDKNTPREIPDVEMLLQLSGAMTWYILIFDHWNKLRGFSLKENAQV